MLGNSHQSTNRNSLYRASSSLIDIAERPSRRADQFSDLPRGSSGESVVVVVFEAGVSARRAVQKCDCTPDGRGASCAL